MFQSRRVGSIGRFAMSSGDLAVGEGVVKIGVECSNEREKVVEGGLSDTSFVSKKDVGIQSGEFIFFLFVIFVVWKF